MTKELHVLFFSLLLFSCSFAQEDLPHEDDDDNLNNVSYIILSPLLALFVMGFIGILFLMGCIFITLKELLRRQINTTLDQSDNSRRASCVSTCGINGVEIEGFPMFVYSDVKGIQTGDDDDQLTMECNICLNEFEDDEMLRLLPVCGHMFHPDCINTWLASHVTCPVCRDILVVPCPGRDNDTAPVTVLVHTGHDSVPVSEPCSLISGQT